MEKLFNVEEYDFDLPPELIAQRPCSHRTHARLMLVDRTSGQISHHRVLDLPDLLEEQDLVVLNDTRVFPARLFARAKNRPIEVLLLRQAEDALVWTVLGRPGRQLKPGKRLVFLKGELEAIVLETKPGPTRKIRFEFDGDLWSQIEKAGSVPLPPYIRRPSDEEDRTRYQTVFGKVRGSVAAPTAGLHFDTKILKGLRHCYVTLHVGYGTFKPVTETDIRKHLVDPETFHISSETRSRIRTEKENGGRIVTVGTTTTRVLEHLARINDGGNLTAETDLYIYPGFQFRLVDKLMTNFHLPKSSLLFLVSAFAGPTLVREAYLQAVSSGYRFYSYGDAMLIV